MLDGSRDQGGGFHELSPWTFDVPYQAYEFWMAGAEARFAKKIGSPTPPKLAVDKFVLKEGKRGRRTMAEEQDVDQQDGEGVTFNEGQLSCFAQNWDAIPAHISRKYGERTRRLDLSFNVFRKLGDLAPFSQLEELIVDNNEVGDDVEFPRLAKLHTLMLNKNRLVNLDGFLDHVGRQLPALRFLSLLGNVACPNELSSSEKDEEDYQRYRYFVLYKLPKLRFLDSRPVSDRERSEAQRVGQFMRVVRADEGNVRERSSSGAGDFNGPSGDYTPLPQGLANTGEHRGTFGVCRYVYYGRHSEGNRFIRNNDL